jgi:MFS family permease
MEWGQRPRRRSHRPLLGFGLAAYGYGTISALLVLYLTDRGLGGSRIGLAVFAAAFLAARWAGSPAVDRYGGAPVAVTVLTVEAAGFVLLAAVPTLPGALAGAALAGVGVSLMFPATVALTLHRSPDPGPGTSVGATTSFWDLGILIASPLSGLVAARAGYPAAFTIAAATALAAAALAIALGRTARSTTDDDSSQTHPTQMTLPRGKPARAWPTASPSQCYSGKRRENADIAVEGVKEDG